MPTVAVELGTRSNGVDRKGVLSRTDTSSDAAAVSQVSSNKPRDQRCRARRKAASPQSPHEMPDPEDPQTRFAAVSFHLPLTNSVPQVELVQSCVCQSIAASAICDASQQEAPRCVSTARVRKSDSPSPRIIRNCGWYIVSCRAIAIEDQCVSTVDEALLPQARRRPSIEHQPLRLVRRPVGSGTVF